MEIFGETIGTIILVGAVFGVLYAFYRVLKFGLDTTKQHDD